jgi:hypothetical protein
MIAGIKSYIINLNDEQVTIETNLPSGNVQQILEGTGRKAILRGHGTTQGIGQVLPKDACSTTQLIK